MKNNTRKSLIKSARKVIREEIKQSLSTQMKDVVEKLIQSSKKTNKEIEKSSRQLAKKLSKELKIDEITLLKVENAGKTSKISPDFSNDKATIHAEVKIDPATSEPHSGNKAKPVTAKTKSVKKTTVPVEV